MDTETCEYPFLEQVSNSGGEQKIDLVFVHGLNSFGRNRHPYETWTHANGTFWPTVFLAEDLPCARIFVYGYNSTVANAEQMSTARIKDHADTLLNLLDLERGPQQGLQASKIIFVGHSLGGIVIKQALLNARDDPKYTKILNATFGLVFFGTPHHGARGVELGKLAARLAKFVSKGHASNELLNCLEHNSLFTRHMSERFQHQLEDYRVVSFVEGKPMILVERGIPFPSQMIVDRDSAVLGLPGSRETQLTLDADHSTMCKIGTKGPMYRIVMGNIKNLVDQALILSQGYIPPPSSRSPEPAASTMPPNFRSYGSTSLPAAQRIEPKVTGYLYAPTGDDPKSIQLAELKNAGCYDQARVIAMQVYGERLRNLGTDHLDTLTSGYEIALIDTGLAMMDSASRWADWVSSTCRRTLGPRHPLLMKADSLRGVILLEQGQTQQANALLGDVFARQQDTLGDDHLDTLETQGRLAMAAQAAGRREDALARCKKRSEMLARLLGKNHIRFFSSMLDLVQVMRPALGDDLLGTARFSNEVHQASQIVAEIQRDLRSSLGPQHPLAIRALCESGTIKSLEGENTEASDILRRALSNAEDALGPDHPETMTIVISIALVYIKAQSPTAMFQGGGTSEALPWLQRYLEWVEKRKGPDSSETRGTLCLLGGYYMGVKDYVEAEKYYDRLVRSFGADNSKGAQEARTMLQLCKMNTMLIAPRYDGGDLAGFLSSLRF